MTTTSQPDPSPVYQWSMVIGFLSLLCTPLFCLTWSGEVEYVTQVENRSTKSFPHVEFRDRGGIRIPRRHSLNSFPKAFEGWFNDRVGFRGPLIQGHTLARLVGLTASAPAYQNTMRNSVIVGKEGWMFRGDELRKDLQGQKLTRKKLETWRLAFEERQAWLAARGIRFAVMVAPEAHHIYGEYVDLPGMDRVQYRLDQFLNYMRDNSSVEFIDPRAALRQAKATHLTYQKTDLHWNEYGAYIGYRQLMTHLQRWDTRFQPLGIDKFRVTHENVRPATGNLVRMLNSPLPFTEELVLLVPRFRSNVSKEQLPRNTTYDSQMAIASQQGTSLPTAFIIHDSFFIKMSKYVDEHFSRATYLCTHEFPADLIIKDQPDIVVQEFVEWVLHEELPRNPALMQSDPGGSRPPLRTATLPSGATR